MTTPTPPLEWTERDGIYRATGREDRQYTVRRFEPIHYRELPWLAMTTAAHKPPRQCHSAAEARRLCEAWETLFGTTDALLMGGDLEWAERLRAELYEPDYEETKRMDDDDE